MLTPAAIAAKHRRARDKKVARNSVLVDRQRQGMSRRRTVQLQARCGRGERANGEWDWCASWPGPVAEQSDSGTGVLSPSPSLRQNIQKVQRVTTGTIPGTSMTFATIGPVSGRVITMAADGFMVGTSAVTATTGRMLGESGTLVTSGVRGIGKRAAGARATGRWNETDRRSDDREGQQWSNHSFFETKSVNQLINSLCRGDDDAATFTGIEVDPGESLADTAAQSGIIDVRPFRKAEEPLFHKFGLQPRVIPGDNQAVGIGGRAKVLGKVETPSGMGGVNGKVKKTVVDSWSSSFDTCVSSQTGRCLPMVVGKLQHWNRLICFK